MLIRLIVLDHHKENDSEICMDIKFNLSRQEDRIFSVDYEFAYTYTY